MGETARLRKELHPGWDAQAYNIARSHHSQSAPEKAGIWLGRQPQELERALFIPTSNRHIWLGIRRVRQQFLRAGYPVYQCRYQEQRTDRQLRQIKVVLGVRLREQVNGDQ